jgi:hypothetical protein
MSAFREKVDMARLDRKLPFLTHNGHFWIGMTIYLEVNAGYSDYR